MADRTWEDEVERIERCLSMARNVPKRGAEFADGVTDKLKSMQVWIREHQLVTISMSNAISNIERGIKAWTHSSRGSRLAFDEDDE
jgi:hypothetical protein